MSLNRIAASTPCRRTGWRVISVTRSGRAQASSMAMPSRTFRYSGSDRPAWRMNQTGVCGTGSPRQARRKAELCSASAGTAGVLSTGRRGGVTRRDQHHAAPAPARPRPPAGGRAARGGTPGQQHGEHRVERAEHRHHGDRAAPAREAEGEVRRQVAEADQGDQAQLAWSHQHLGARQPAGQSDEQRDAQDRHRGHAHGHQRHQRAGPAALGDREQREPEAHGRDTGEEDRPGARAAGQLRPAGQHDTHDGDHDAGQLQRAGRSPSARPTATGTTTPSAAMGETTPIVPAARAA